jgi:G-protein coupled receptor 98
LNKHIKAIYSNKVVLFTVLHIFSEIKEIFETPSRKDVTPLSGYLRFPDKVRRAYINMSSLDDKEEENNEVFSIRLISAKGGGRVSTNDYSGILKGRLGH